MIIASEPVDYPCVTDPTTFVAMSQEAYNTYGKNGHFRVALIDSDLVEAPAGTTPEPVRIPFTATAESLGKKLVTNTVMLGALVGRTEVVSPESVKRALEDVLPKKVIELNLRAFAKGHELGRAAKGGSP